MGGQPKKPKAALPSEVLVKARAVARPARPAPPPNERKVKVIAALKRLHPMD